MRPLASDLSISTMEPDRLSLTWRPSSVPPPSTSRGATPLSTPAPTSYQIEALEYPSREWRPLASDIKDTSYQLTGLAPTKDYSFRVRAMTPSGGFAEPTAPITVSSLPGQFQLYYNLLNPFTYSCALGAYWRSQA